MGLFLSMGVPHWRSILQLGANKGLVGHFSNSGGLSLNAVPNETKSFICGGSNSVHMDVPTQVTGDIHPQVPGTADNLRARLAKRREILIFPRTAGNTGNSREITGK